MYTENIMYNIMIIPTKDINYLFIVSIEQNKILKSKIDTFLILLLQYR